MAVSEKPCSSSCKNNETVPDDRYSLKVVYIVCFGFLRSQSTLSSKMNTC